MLKDSHSVQTHCTGHNITVEKIALQLLQLGKFDQVFGGGVESAKTQREA